MPVAIKPPRIFESLPSFSPVASRLLGMAMQERASMKDIGSLIEMDPALSTDVLRLANSPLYAQRIEVTSILRALAMIGTEAVRGMVLTVALRNYSRSATSAPVFRQCWRHNLACALISADLAAVSRSERDSGYTLGLLHDAGRLALLAASPVTYSRLLQGGAPDAAAMLEMERELFEMDHCQLGQYLADLWNLPADFHSAMLHHHSPAAGQRSSTQIVHLACDLADMAGFPAWGTPKDWNTTELLEQFPDAGSAILDASELIPRVAAGINALECTLLV